MRTAKPVATKRNMIIHHDLESVADCSHQGQGHGFTCCVKGQDYTDGLNSQCLSILYLLNCLTLAFQLS